MKRKNEPKKNYNEDYKKLGNLVKKFVGNRPKPKGKVKV